MSIFPTEYCSPNVSSYGSSSFDVLNNGEVMGGELAPESCGRKKCSPCNEHDRNDAAHFVFSNGYVFGNWEVSVWDSYGNHFSFSPDLVYYSDYAYCIDKRGAVYDNDQYVAETSYGIFFF